MRAIRKQILADEAQRPVAVQIAYADWLAIEERLNDLEDGSAASKWPPDLSAYVGVVKLSEDPVEYQDRVRGEWV